MKLSKDFTVCLLVLFVLVLYSGMCSPMTKPVVATAMRSQWHKTIENVEKLGKALVVYQVANGRLPDTLEELAESHPDLRKLQDSIGWTSDHKDILTPIDLRAYPYHTNIMLVYQERERTLQQPRYYYDPKGIKVHNGKRPPLVPLVVANPVRPGGLMALKFETSRTLAPDPKDALQMIAGPFVTNAIRYSIPPPPPKKSDKK